MVDKLTDRMHREWNLTNDDTYNTNYGIGTSRSLQSHVFSRGSADHDDHSHSNRSHHQHTHQHQPKVPTAPTITTTDYSDQSSLSNMHVSQALFNRNNLDKGYDTDGGIGTSTYGTKHHHHRSSNAYEYLVSPRLPSKRSLLKQTKQVPPIPPHHHHHHHPSQSNHLTVNPYSGIAHNHDDRDEEQDNEEDKHRRHIRLSRRVQRRSPSTKNRDIQRTHSPKISHHERILANTTSGRPLRLIFMRHSERANQALGPEWFIRAFRTGIYQAYDQNLPLTIPKRRSDQAYQFDSPLTARGLKNARNTGSAMLSANLIADVCLSSTALRCIQTAERVLAGMNRNDRISIRVEPGLFECPHLNHKIVESFMTKKELVENGFKIKVEYKPLIEKIDVPESLDDYFNRCVNVMQGIVDRYSHQGGTILIVTHAPGLLALTDAIQGKRPDQETFYRTVAAYPPLAMHTAEFDGTKWKLSEQPFSITPLQQ